MTYDIIIATTKTFVKNTSRFPDIGYTNYLLQNWGISMSIIESLIDPYGLPALFLLILLEYACFPVSSELVLPLAGLLGSRQNMPFVVLVLLSTAAGLIGTFLTYLAGRLGGSPLLERAMKRFPTLEKPILASYRIFGNHGGIAVFLSRLVPLCRTYIGFVAGAVKQSLVSYLVCSAVGILFWNTLLTGIGYYFYQYRGVLLHSFVQYKNWFFFGGIFLLFILAVRRILSSDKKDGAGPEESESPRPFR